MLIAVAFILIAIQFIRPKKNIETSVQKSDIRIKYNVPRNVISLLEKACYDCHSNNSRYPWYTYIQPIAWITAHHIEEGKRELNFSEFGTYSLKKSNHKLEEVEETVNHREMPIKSYLQLHPEADLTDNEKNLLIMWSKDLRSNLLK